MLSNRKVLATSVITCDKPPNIPGTTHTHTSMEVGATVVYSCPDGQHPAPGSAMISACDVDGNWGNIDIRCLG